MKGELIGDGSGRKVDASDDKVANSQLIFRLLAACAARGAW
jgi:hypothetical protein